MQTSIYTQTEPEWVCSRRSHAGDSNVCGRQQLSCHCPDLEGQSAKRGELGQAIHGEASRCTGSEKAQGCGTRRIIHLCWAEKNEIYVLTVVDRATHCLLSWDAVPERTSETLQACLERGPQARQYYSDAFPAYNTLYYGAPYEMRTDKLETYSVEAVNADLRHYLKRLARKSRCFSRRMASLIGNLKLFVYCYNHRQLAKRQHPKYSYHLIDFLPTLV